MGRKEKRQEKKIKIKKIEKILWIIIILTIALIGIVVAIKIPIKNKNTDDIVSENDNWQEDKVFYSLEKDEIANTVKILFTIKSDIGIKKIELPDGSEQEFNNDKEIKIDYVVDRNGEYIINIKETNEDVIQKKVVITAIS